MCDVKNDKNTALVLLAILLLSIQAQAVTSHYEEQKCSCEQAIYIFDILREYHIEVYGREPTTNEMLNQLDVLFHIDWIPFYDFTDSEEEEKMREYVRVKLEDKGWVDKEPPKYIVTKYFGVIDTRHYLASYHMVRVSKILGIGTFIGFVTEAGQTVTGSTSAFQYEDMPSHALADIIYSIERLRYPQKKMTVEESFAMMCSLTKAESEPNMPPIYFNAKGHPNYINPTPFPFVSFPNPRYAS